MIISSLPTFYLSLSLYIYLSLSLSIYLSLSLYIYIYIVLTTVRSARQAFQEKANTIISADPKTGTVSIVGPPRGLQPICEVTPR